MLDTTNNNSSLDLVDIVRDVDIEIHWDTGDPSPLPDIISYIELYKEMSWDNIQWAEVWVKGTRPLDLRAENPQEMLMLIIVSMLATQGGPSCSRNS